MKKTLKIGSLIAFLPIINAMIPFSPNAPLWTNATCANETLLGQDTHPVPISLIESNNGKTKIYWQTEMLLPEGNAPASRSLEWGGRFVIARCVADGRWEVLGEGTVSDRQGNVVAGLLENPPNPRQREQGSAANLSFNQYPYPMVGDHVIALRSHVATKKQVRPNTIFPLELVFKNNLSSDKVTSDFEAQPTPEGKTALLDTVAYLALKSQEKLIIEVFLDLAQPPEAAQMNSMAIADTLASTIKSSGILRNDQVIALGHGLAAQTSGWKQTLVEGTSSRGYIHLKKINVENASALDR